MKNLFKKITVFSLCLICFSSCFTYSKIEESKSKDFEKKFTSEMFEKNKKYQILTNNQKEYKVVIKEVYDEKISVKLLVDNNVNRESNNLGLFEIPYSRIEEVKVYKYRPLISLGIIGGIATAFAIYQLNNMNFTLNW